MVISGVVLERFIRVALVLKHPLGGVVRFGAVRAPEASNRFTWLPANAADQLIVLDNLGNQIEVIVRVVPVNDRNRAQLLLLKDCLIRQATVDHIGRGDQYAWIFRPVLCDHNRTAAPVHESAKRTGDRCEHVVRALK